MWLQLLIMCVLGVWVAVIVYNHLVLGPFGKHEATFTPS